MEELGEDMGADEAVGAGEEDVFQLAGDQGWYYSLRLCDDGDVLRVAPATETIDE